MEWSQLEPNSGSHCRGDRWTYGKGLGDGMQAKLGYLPSAVAHNDFIFAVLAEESGLLGSTLALLAILWSYLVA